MRDFENMMNNTVKMSNRMVRLQEIGVDIQTAAREDALKLSDEDFEKLIDRMRGSVRDQ